MSRLRSNYPKNIGTRLRSILDEIRGEDGKRLSHAEIARKSGITPQTLSYILNDKQELTPTIARAIISNCCPEVRLSYMLCEDDAKTEKDVSLCALSKAQFESASMYYGLYNFAILNGFSISEYNYKESGDEVEEVISHIESWYTIGKNRDSISISMDEMNALENEVSDFVEFKLNQLMKRHSEH